HAEQRAARALKAAGPAIRHPRTGYRTNDLAEHFDLLAIFADRAKNPGLGSGNGGVRPRQTDTRTAEAWTSPAPTQGRFALGQERVHDLGDRFLLRHHTDRLPGHQAAVLDVAVDGRAAKSACPIALDLELRVGHLDLPRIEQVGDFALLEVEQLAALVPQRADRDDRQARVDLHARHGITRAGPGEGLLEGWVSDALGRAGETGAQLHAHRAHFEIAGDRFAAADPAGDEHQVLLGQRGKEFLGQDARRNRTDVAARFHSFDHQRIGPGA